MFEARSVEVFERLMAGISPEVAGAECGLSADAVRHIKHRVLERLKELVASQVRAEDEPDG
jgi:DNA-directed RNA polymerase specialized sigma24 family protein